ncbi:MAG: hypothetical protein ACPLRZ_07780 [Thermovenabulum sp.]|uniref:hypothetical protein n=1 Tax=Thermovenabulum sp. TaxID=3100335 RepID=UPI003C7E526E
MPNRILKESICTSDTIAQLSPEEEIFFYRLLVVCDDYGRMDARPAILRARCFPLKIDQVTEEKISAWLKKLADVGLIEIYVVEDKPYLQIRTWEKHQQIRAKNSKYPSPDEGIKSNDIICNHMKSNDSICPRESIYENRESIYENNNNISSEILSSKTDDAQTSEPTLTQSTKETQDVSNNLQNKLKLSDVVEIYNSICVSLPKVVTISEKRKKQIRALLKKIRDETELRTVFMKAEESDFLSGRSGRWNGCNFDWLINYNNFIKVLEGTYDNKETGVYSDGRNPQHKRSDEKNATAGAYEKFYE